MEKTKIKYYAPVIITTLCRYEHFKRCVESLARCTGAENTELYIGLDYPFKESHIEGWQKLCNYIPTIIGFKNIYVYKRQENFGSFRNGEELLKVVYEKYDRYIGTEDDNEFSPNFLQFINRGLELYKDDPSIMLISGYSFPDIAAMNIDNNVIAFRKAAGWGCGYWRKKRFKYDVIGRSQYVEDVLRSWHDSFTLLFKRPISLNSLLSMRFRNETYGDSLRCDCMLLENKYCLFPKKSTVRNWGHDGSGEHCSNTDVYKKQEIDDKEDFIYDELKYSNKLPYDQLVDDKIGDFFLRLLLPFGVLLRYLIYRLFEKDIFWKYFEKRSV